MATPFDYYQQLLKGLKEGNEAGHSAAVLSPEQAASVSAACDFVGASPANLAGVACIIALLVSADPHFGLIFATEVAKLRDVG